ncbi:MAG: hypothetical protein R3E79_18385 [Caldilineaceae bacterium]
MAIVNPAGFRQEGTSATPIAMQPAVLGQPVLRPSPTPTAAEPLVIEPVGQAPALQPETAPASMILVPTATAANVIMPPIVTVVPQVRALPGVELKRSFTAEPPTPTPSPPRLRADLSQCRPSLVHLYAAVGAGQ